MKPLTLVTFGDSILDCGRYNDAGITPGQLLERNDDQRFPEFAGRDLGALRSVRLEHRALDGSTVLGLAQQARNLRVTGATIGLLAIGGNDLLNGLMADSGPGIDLFAQRLELFLSDFPSKPSLIGASEVRQAFLDPVVASWGDL